MRGRRATLTSARVVHAPAARHGVGAGDVQARREAGVGVPTHSSVTVVVIQSPDGVVPGVVRVRKPAQRARTAHTHTHAAWVGGKHKARGARREPAKGQGFGELRSMNSQFAGLIPLATVLHRVSLQVDDDLLAVVVNHQPIAIGVCRARRRHLHANVQRVGPHDRHVPALVHLGRVQHLVRGQPLWCSSTKHRAQMNEVWACTRCAVAQHGEAYAHAAPADVLRNCSTATRTGSARQ